ncbi:hypothetical protein NDK25_21995 [Niallia taxi]|nr:hypothetical protein [Niallia taxi]MDE5054890.1 hypothetical protein [Niallia taxi]
MKEQLISNVEKLNVSDGDTVVLKSDNISYKQMQEISHHLIEKGKKNVTFIKLGINDAVESINEEQMNRLGWYKKQ